MYAKRTHVTYIAYPNRYHNSIQEVAYLLSQEVTESRRPLFSFLFFFLLLFSGLARTVVLRKD